MNFVSIWLFKHYSYTSLLTLSAFLQLFGGWLRSFAFVNDRFWPLLAGTSILSLSSELIWQSQNFLINKWFPVKEYAFATGLMMASNFAKLIGFATTGIFFADPARETIHNLD
jgi:MFS family permease